MKLPRLLVAFAAFLAALLLALFLLPEDNGSPNSNEQPPSQQSAPPSGGDTTQPASSPTSQPPDPSSAQHPAPSFASQAPPTRPSLPPSQKAPALPPLSKERPPAARQAAQFFAARPQALQPVSPAELASVRFPERWQSGRILGMARDPQTGRTVTLIQPDSLPYPIRIAGPLHPDDSKSPETFSNPTPPALQPEMVADRLIINLGPEATDAEAQAVAASLGATVERRLNALGAFRLRLPAVEFDGVPKALAALEAKGISADPDYIVWANSTPNDPRFADGSLWGLHNTGQEGGTPDADIDAPEGWAIRTAAPDIIVAVIDSGVRYTHQDLADNMWVNPGETGTDSLGRDKRTNGVDDDGNGFIDDVHGINAITGSGNPMDDNGHGTHCAGTIAARGNNGLGVVGVAWQAKIMALKFLSAAGGGALSDAITCLEYARNKGAHVLSNSWGGGDYNVALVDAILAARDADQPFIVAAGNSARNNDYEPTYPASYTIENVLAVASMNRLEALSSFSNYGYGTVHVAAPGSGIVSTYSGADDDYKLLNGTSMACPHVAGIAALLRAQFPSDNYRQTIHRILRSVEVFPAYTGKVQTNGRVNLHRALTTTKNTPANDDFAEPLFVPGPENALLTYNIGATAEPGEPNHAGVAPQKTLWFTYTANFTGPIVLNTAGSEFDTVLAVYTGTALGSLTLVAQNDNETSSVTTSKVIFNATNGTTYRIAVGSKNGAEGAIYLVFARPPSNDNFASPEVLSGDAIIRDGSNYNASKEPGEPNHAGHPGGASVWFTWTAPMTSPYTISTVGGTFFDSLLAVYTGDSLDNLTLIAANDDYNTFATSRVTINAVAGTTYRIAIDAKNGVGGTYKLTIGRPPTNDNFADAITINGNPPLTVTGRNFGATIEPGEPNHSTREGVPSANSVWWKWTPAQSGTYQISLEGSNFDTVLAVYTGNAVNNLTLIAANDDFIGWTSYLSFTARAGVPYYIAVDGYSGASGNIELKLLPPPVAMTNDYYADRIFLYGAQISVDGSNVGAEHEYPAEDLSKIGSPDPTQQDIYENRTVWWDWTAPANGTVTIDTRYSSFDTVLFVCTGNALNNPTPVAWNDDIGMENNIYLRQSSVTFNAVRDTSYKIMVMGRDWTRFGAIRLNINQPLSNQLPVIHSASLSPANAIFSNQTITVANITASDPENDPISFTYQWQSSTDGGLTWTNAPGQTNASLPPNDANAGRLWRCIVTPRDATGTGEPYTTGFIALDRPPPSIAALGQPFSYQSGLVIPSRANPGNRKVLLTEISQGSNPAQRSEWFEFLVLRPRDLRRHYFMTSTGGYILLTSHSLWQNVPAGTLVVIYDAANRDPILPPDNFDPSDGRLIIPSNSTLYIRQFSTNPSGWFNAQNATIGGFDLDDAIRITDNRWVADDTEPPSPGSLLDGIHWGYFANGITADTPQVYQIEGLPEGQALIFTADDPAFAENGAAWEKLPATAANATPGEPNNLAQRDWIAALREPPPRWRIADTSDPLPPGLTLNATTGLLSGTPTGNVSQTYNLVLERYSSVENVRRPFTLRLVAPGVSTATVYEPFNYPLNQSLVNATATGTGLSGTWTTPNNLQANVTSSSLAAPGLPSAGARFNTTASGTADLYVPLTTAARQALNPPANGSRTIWMSFTVRLPATGGQPGVHLARDASTPIAGVRVSDSSARFWVCRNGAVTGDGTASPNNSIVANTDYFVLARFVVTNTSGNASDGWANPGTIAADAWVYPLNSPPSTEPTGTGTATFSARTDGTGNRYINGLLIRGSSAAAGLQVDEIRIATTFDQVARDPVDGSPSSLTALPTGPGSIQLAWVDHASNETGFRLEVSPDGNSWSTLATLPANSTAYLHTGLGNSTTRFYRVCATNPSGDSGFAGPVSATTWSTLAVWRHTHFGTTANSGNASDSADPDADGVVNLIEHALGGDPNSPASRPQTAVGTTIVSGQQRLTLTFTPQVVTGLTYIVQASNDLGTWTDTDVTSSLTPGQPFTFTDSADLSSTPRRFLRLQIRSSQ